MSRVSREMLNMIYYFNEDFILDVRDDRFEQIPIVRRTIIVEPVPAPPTSTIVVKPKTKVIADVHVSGQDVSNKSNPKGAAGRNIKKK